MLSQLEHLGFPIDRLFDDELYPEHTGSQGDDDPYPPTDVSKPSSHFDMPCSLFDKDLEGLSTNVTWTFLRQKVVLMLFDWRNVRLGVPPEAF